MITSADVARPVPARSPSNPLLRAFEAVRRRLPEGGGLPEEVWQRRHRGILTLLWLHVPGIILFGLAVGGHARHLVVEVAPLAAAAVAAGRLRHRRVLSTVLTSTGLVTASAVIVHLSGGVIETHFHFFVMVGVVVLYQEWWPFLVALGYVVLHHGTVGTFTPVSVYNHAAAVESPWKWAAIHGTFILAMSTAGIVTWRLNESLRKAAVLSEQRLAEAQQLAHMGSWELDMDSQQISSSDELKRMFGLGSAGDTTMGRFAERVHPEDREQLVRGMRQVGETGSPMSVDFRIVAESGAVRWLHGRGEAVVDQYGTVTRVRGTAQDITERKRAEAALSKESMVRRLLQTVAAAANEARTVPAALEVAVEQVCRFTDWPVGHAFLSGGPGKPLVSAGVWYLGEHDRFDHFRRVTEETELDVGAGLAGRVWKAAAPVWVTDLSRDEGFTRRDAARQVGLCSAAAFPILVSEEVAGVVEIFSTRAEPFDDELLGVMVQVGRQLGLVLERTRATDALRASEEHNRTIVETASDAFIGMDEHGAIVSWNERAEAMFGWSREEAIGRELAQTVIPEELREGHREGARRYLRTDSGRVMSGRMSLDAMRRDGTRFPVELSVWEVRSAAGRQFNAFVRDITHHRQAEEALAAARDHALEASRLKSEFLANMSHEIRTPMNGVIGLTSLLLDTSLDGTQRKYAEGIQSAGEVLLTLINDILDFSKAEAGKIEVEQVDFDLQHVIGGATDLLAGAAAAKGIDLVRYSDPTLPSLVRGDPARLRQVLVNLVGNGVKFTEQGEVVVRALLEEDSGDAIRARFEVVDTGIGIDPASHPRIFESFTQADASTTRRYGGTGLGLALCKRLVELMGGEIGLQSELGAGSTFWFTIPLVRQRGMPAGGAGLLTPEWARSAPGDSDEAPPEQEADGWRGHVLVVEDNPINRTVAIATLAKLGYRADLAINGREAVEAMSRRVYSAVLMDCQMPDMDGYQATREIRERENDDGHVPIIAMTAAALEGDRERCLAAGMDDYIAKPVRVEEVDVVLARWLRPDWPSEPLRPTRGERDEVLDPSHLEELRRLGADTGNPDLSAQLVSEFLRQMTAHLYELRDADGRRDPQALGHAAHTLAGITAAIGAQRASSASVAVEAAAGSGDFGEVGERLQVLETELRSVTRALEPHAAGAQART